FDGFYDLLEGGDASQGYDLNPVTGEVYPPQIVPRGDYVRVLAEFWADGPDSETPPGHWFTLLNDVMDHPDFVRQMGGEGPILGELEYDVKAYLAMGGCMHDSAITAWGVKGWYDYVRPVSVVRWMAENGQRTDPAQPNYHPQGLRLIPGLVEIVTEKTIVPGGRHEHLAGPGDANLGKIAAFCWRGPDFINNPETDTASCDWTLAESWWPYQRPTFVTPNFAGYVSGHSTFSRAAAELMTRMTGSEYFPGGLAEYLASRGSFLVFEDGPTVNVRLQWVSYRDASDQCSLSRIWGGIHPPADDIPGRLMGLVIGPQAWDLAVEHFNGSGCPEDINGDGIVNAADLGSLIGNWGCKGPDCVADVNQDGIVNSADLGLVIGAWNQDC
ncbi:dockerin type I domain-containing protein, partial [Phycisphaerales bacterium]|nr:dockerin type I domain-containing protein [Phycisphaerales bacterium]